MPTCKVCKSRKSTFSVMNHTGAGSLTITKGELIFVVPINNLCKNGKLKRKVAEFIRQLAYVELVDLGVTIFSIK